eukprot:scaffold21796_cov124-Isochrysis_galbana.AAC.1
MLSELAKVPFTYGNLHDRTMASSSSMSNCVRTYRASAGHSEKSTTEGGAFARLRQRITKGHWHLAVGGWRILL